MTRVIGIGTNVNLGDRARRSVIWNTGLVTAISFGQFGLMLLLVRLLSPAIYGEYGVLMGIIGFVYVFSAQSFADYIFQVREDGKLNVQDIFTACVMVNVLLCLLTNLIALSLSFHAEYAHLSTPLHWLSLSFLLQPGRAIRVAELKRALDWRRIRLLHFIGFLLSAIASITIALHGGGIYALLAPHFLVPLPFLYDVFIICRWRPSWSWSYSAFRPAFRFGLNRQASGAFGAGRRLLENSAVSYVLGFGSLGLMTRALGLGDIVCNRLHGHALDALYPALTKLEQGSENLARVNGLVLRVTTWFCIPIAVLTTELADPIVRTIYGSQWLEVIPLMGWALGIAAVGAVNFCLYKLALASNLTRQCLTLDVMLFIGTIACILLLLVDGLLPYLRGLLLMQVGVVVVALRWLIRHRVVSPRILFECLLVPALATTVALLAYESVARLLASETQAAISLLLASLAFSLTYVGILRLGFARLLSEMLGYFPMRSSLRRILVLA